MGSNAFRLGEPRFQRILWVLPSPETTTQYETGSRFRREQLS